MIIKAKNYAAFCLGKKNYTEQELYKKLCEKGYEECAAEVIAEFVKAGVLNDKDYAYMYISDGVNIKYKGLYRISRELSEKGVDKRIISEVSEEFCEASYNALCEFVRAHYGEEKISDRKTLERIKAQLLRRGFSYEEIRNCFDDFDWSEKY